MTWFFPPDSIVPILQMKPYMTSTAGTVFLQARDQLLVVESAEARSDKTYLAQTLGTRKREFPSCPSQSHVILYEHQITLRPDTWGGLQDALDRFFSSG